MSIPKKLIRLVRVSISGSKCVVHIGSYLSEPFDTNSGMRQGKAALGCLNFLFNFAVEKTVRDLKSKFGPPSTELFSYDFDITA